MRRPLERRRRNLARPAILRGAGFAVWVVLGLAAAQGASAEARFGDTTWVAPRAPITDPPTSAGPRVAPADHERGWETALRAPFRVAGLPLRLVGAGSEALVGRFGARFLEPQPPHPPKRGLTIGATASAGNAVDIGLGPSITWVGFPTADSRLNVRGTWSTWDRRTAHFSEQIGQHRPVGFKLRADYDSKPNRRYYGIGNDSRKVDQSFYHLESSSAEAALLLGASPLQQLRVLGGFSSMAPSRGAHGSPLLEDRFTPATAPFDHRATRQWFYGLAGDVARLDDGRDPSRGVHGRFDARRAMGMRGEDPDDDQWLVEGRGYVPVFAKRRVLVVRAVYAGLTPRGDSADVFPFYRLTESNAALRFSGYSSERFRDRQLALARAEYRWTVYMRLSALGFYEWGEVAPRANAFTADAAHTDFGGGFRIGLSEASTLRFELGKSVEGYHAFFVVGGDF